MKEHTVPLSDVGDKELIDMLGESADDITELHCKYLKADLDLQVGISNLFGKMQAKGKKIGEAERALKLEPEYRAYMELSINAEVAYKKAQNYYDVLKKIANLIEARMRAGLNG